MKSLLYTSTILVLLNLTSCSGINCVSGEGEVITTQIDIDLFTEISLSSSVDVELSYGRNQKVEVTGHKNHIDLISKKVTGQEWAIRFKESVCNHDMTIHITMPDLNRIEIDGSGDITALTPFQAEELELIIDGSGDLEMNVSAEELTLLIDGSGNMKLDGYADILDVEIDGSGDVKAIGLEAKELILDSNGSGDVDVSVKDRIKADIQGSGSLRYAGDPEDRELDLSGSGEVLKK